MQLQRLQGVKGPDVHTLRQETHQRRKQASERLDLLKPLWQQIQIASAEGERLHKLLEQDQETLARANARITERKERLDAIAKKVVQLKDEQLQQEHIRAQVNAESWDTWDQPGKDAWDWHHEDEKQKEEDGEKANLELFSRALKGDLQALRQVHFLLTPDHKT